MSAQTPTKCLEIESILVDACVPGGGCTSATSPSCNCEGKNEMVRFKIGPANINISDLSIVWPNNSFLGISAPNATTASLVSALNATILSCGYLIEPIAGVLPAGRTILIITSTEMCTTANSFANLSDTIYVIFQNAGNFQGHFVNYSSVPGLRTTIFKQISSGCADTVTYDKSLLVNQLGGYGGSSAINDGSTVQFSWPGVANYINIGCQAPLATNTSNAGTGGSICPSGTISLSGTATGSYTGVIWQGGLGSFSSPTSLTTNYTAAVGDSGAITLTLGVIGFCSDTVFSSLIVNITPLPTANISASGSISICAGSTVTLTASGGSTYLWSTTATTSSITVATAGTYTVISSNVCGSQQDTMSVFVTPLPSVTINNSLSDSLCIGDTLILWATGIGNYVWSGGSTNDSIVVTVAGTYSVTATNSCGTVNDALTIISISAPTPLITPGGSTAICLGDSVSLTASGGGTYLWNTGSSNTTIFASTAGTYTVTATNGCGSNTTTTTITNINPPTASITPGGPTNFCLGDSVVLNANGGGAYIWSTGETTSSITASNGGNYWLVASNTCGSDTSTITVNVDSVIAFFTNDVSSGTPPLTVNFTNGSSPNASSFFWNFGDGTTGSGTTVGNMFQAAGTYIVTLTVTNSNGCADTYSINIIVLENPSVLIVPNIFSPNNDGQNDFFIVTGTNIKDFQCSIYDRWGLKLANLSSIVDGWNGRTASGALATDGAYYYIIKATGLDKKEYSAKGFLQLVR